MREHQRRRILFAALDVFSVKGFAAATVKDLIQAAHVSRATYYRLFADREACFEALYDDVLAWLWDDVAEAAGEEAAWPPRLRVVVERTIELLDEDPRLARLCAVEAPIAGSPARARHERLVEELAALLRIGRGEQPGGDRLPEVLEPAFVCGATYLVARSIVYGQDPPPASLAAELTELLLLPYVGTEEARRVARP